MLHDVADRRPLVIAVEDVHWADRTTRDLLVTLLRSRGSTACCSSARIAATSSTVVIRCCRCWPRSSARRRYERIDLVPLDDDEVAELAAAITGEATADAIGRELASRCGGNPFYAEEILAAGPARGRLPEGVRHVVLARSQTLETDALKCIESASTLAAPVDSVVLRSTTELDRDCYRAAIDALCRERFLVEDRSGFGFRHDLVREVFLDELLPGERVELFALRRPAGLVGTSSAVAARGRSPACVSPPPNSTWRCGRRWRRRWRPSRSEPLPRRVSATTVHSDIWPRVDEPETLAACSHFESLRRSARAADLSRDFDQAMELGRLAAAEAADGDPVVEGAVLDEAGEHGHVELQCARARRRDRSGAGSAPDRSAVGRAGADGDPPSQPAPPAREDEASNCVASPGGRDGAGAR